MKRPVAIWEAGRLGLLAFCAGAVYAREMGISVALFKAAMGQLATGVTVITMRAAEEDHGFTASSFTSVSVDPMLVLVCVIRAQRSHALLEESQHFAVNILSSGQKELGMRFANGNLTSRFAGVDIKRATTGAPILPGNLAWVDCRVRDIFPGGDHSIFVGQVLAGEAPGGQDPLAYFNRQWGRFTTP